VEGLDSKLEKEKEINDYNLVRKKSVMEMSLEE